MAIYLNHSCFTSPLNGPNNISLLLQVKTKLQESGEFPHQESAGFSHIAQIIKQEATQYYTSKCPEPFNKMPKQIFHIVVDYIE